MQRVERWRQMVRCGSALIALGLAPATGCASDDESGSEVVVGSENLSEATTDAMFVETVAIQIPFRATVYDGDPRVIRISGEDNLISLIDVTELEMGDWEIKAPQVKFEQHEDIEIRVPYIEMVAITLRSKDIVLGDDPQEVWDETMGGDAGGD